MTFFGPGSGEGGTDWGRIIREFLLWSSRGLLGAIAVVLWNMSHDVSVIKQRLADSEVSRVERVAEFNRWRDGIDRRLSAIETRFFAWPSGGGR